MKNYWLYLKGKRDAVTEINRILRKFIGTKISPLDELFTDLRSAVIVYFKDNRDELKYFTDDLEPFDYHFEVEEKNGYVVSVDFQA